MPSRKRSPSRRRPATGYRWSSPAATARSASWIGTPWRQSGSRARQRCGSSDILRRRFHERVFETALELTEARDLDAGRGQGLQDAGGGGIVAIVVGFDGAVDRYHLVDGRQRLEHGGGFFLLSEHRDAQPPAGGLLPDDFLPRPGRAHPTLVDDADHGAGLGELGRVGARSEGS